MGNQKTIKVSWNQIQGEIYQSLFQAEAYKRQLFVEKSEVPLPWDFTVTHPENLKRAIRVQVKGTKTLCGYRYRITSKQGNTGKSAPIDDSVIDVAAFYVEPLNTWYNIPATSLNSVKSIWLYPQNKDSKGSFECWKHDWSFYNI